MSLRKLSPRTLDKIGFDTFHNDNLKVWRLFMNDFISYFSLEPDFLTKPWSILTYAFIHQGLFELIFMIILLSFSSNSIANLLGKKINTLSSNVFYTAGNHSLVWNGKNQLGDIMATGVYFLRIEAISNNEKTFSASRKMIMLK